MRTRRYAKSGCKGTNISRIDQVFSLFFDILCCFSGVYCSNISCVIQEISLKKFRTTRCYLDFFHIFATKYNLKRKKYEKVCYYLHHIAGNLRFNSM